MIHRNMIHNNMIHKNMIYINKKYRRIISIFMLFVMVTALAAGCGNSQNNTGDGTNTAAGTENQGNNGENVVSTENSEENTAMGRYVENIIDISEYSVQSDTIVMRSDGSLVIQDYYSPQIVSKDNGITWEPEITEWFSQFSENEIYIMDMAYGADGTVGVIYNSHEDSSKPDDESGNESEEKEDAASEETGEEEETDEYEYRLNPMALIIKPDGTQIPVQVPVTKDDIYIKKIWISDTGRIFIGTLGENIYEINGDGSSEKFLTLEKRPELVQFQNDLMVIDGNMYDEMVLYDMAKEEYVEDEVLNDFVNENYKERDNYNDGECFDLFFFFGEDNVIYLAGKRGLHRHVIGGSVVEQVIDGNLSCFNNPSYYLHGMLMLPDNEFIALFDQKAVRFTYDPNIPTVPNERLKVYSLKENNTIRQAVTIFQTNKPEVYVEYEIGMGEDSSITREDALKKLNTQIMAGEGPDVLVLDDMPVDSYIEKNLLLDLSDCLNSLEGDNEIFGNIVNAFKENDKIYMIPGEIQLPMVEGKEKYLSKMKDLKGIADAIEDLDKDDPAKALLYACNEKGIMSIFSMVCAPSWKTDTGELNKEAIEEFLFQCKRIYDVQMDELPDEFIEYYKMITDENLIGYYVGNDSPELSRNIESIDYISGRIQILCGIMKAVWKYADVISIQRVKGYENDIIIPLDGQCKNVFIPVTLTGINAASANIEKAQEFMGILLGKENQTSLFNGFAVNKAAFEEGLTVDESLVSEEGIYIYISVSNTDGTSIDFDVYWPDEEQKQYLRDWVLKVETPYISDSVLEEAVYREGVGYMQGNQSLEETVDAIEESVSIYMSE